MHRPIAVLLAAGAIAATAAPAWAQDGYVLPPPPPPVTAYPEPVYAPMPQAGVVQTTVPVPYPGGPVVQPAPHAAAQYHQYHGATMPHPPQPGLPPLPSVGYTAADRDAWLADCRAQYYGEGRKRGGIIGGLLGAIGGGIIGHEVTDGSSRRRLGGTLVGVGLGGLAGLAIGSVIGAAGDDERIDECEAYLRHYTGGYMPGPGYGHGYGYQYGYQGYTTVMVPVQVQSAYVISAPIRTEHKEVIEEVVEEKVVVPVTTTKYVKTTPAPQPATKYVKDKTVRTTK